MSGVLFLGYDDVVAALDPGDCAQAMAEVLAALARGEAFMPLRSIMAPPGAHGFMGLMPGWRGPRVESGDPPADASGRRGGAGGTFGLKAICLIPTNPSRGLDTHQGLVTLFDGETGIPTAILDASAVTEIRTAAVSAVATRLLAREDATVLAILGAGVQARSHLEALSNVRGFEEIRIYSRTERHARAVAGGHWPRASVAASAQEAVRGADVVVTATSSHEPVLERDWLKPGAHINAVGASTPTSRELDTATVAAAALFVDSRESLRNEAAEFRLAIQEGLIAGEQHVRAELGEVLAGQRPGRRDAEELTVFRSLGLAVEDLAAAECAVASARERGLGTEVRL